MYVNMINTPLNQQQLLQWLDQISFAVNDISLYLDSHPDDEEALNYFQHYMHLRRKALAAYAENYGPLTMDTMDSNCSQWLWSTQKWPWEGGAC